MKKIFLLTLSLFVLLACQNNKLKTNEKNLAQKILSEEEILAQEENFRLEKEKQWADSIAKLPKGFRFKEDRSVDPNYPPELIDIAGNLENTKEIKLSDIAKKVRYIRLASPPDSLFIYGTPKIQFTKNNIITTSWLATCLYSLSGEFIDIICKSELRESLGATPSPPKNVPYFSKYYNIPSQLKTIRKGFSRIQNKGITDLYVNNFSGEDIYFKYRDRAEKKSYLMKYDVTTKSLLLKLPQDNETKNQIVNKRKKVATLTGKTTYNYHILDKNSKIGYQSKWSSVQNGVMLLLENMNGDTLCVFKEPERITNYDATLVRSTESGSKYFYKKQFTYRPAFNDTIFRLIPPNRLLPVFVLNFGEHKTTALEALHPKYSLDGKFLINKWVETSENIFIRYTENRISIHNIKDKKVKFFYAYYNKATKKFFHFLVDPLNYIFKIENDIDGGLPIWPGTLTYEEKLYKSFEGWELKRHVKSKQFRQSVVPQEKKEKLLRLAEVVGDAETIVMIIE